MNLWVIVGRGNFDWTVVSPVERKDSICPLDNKHVAWVRDWSVKLVLELRLPVPDFVWSASGWLVADRVRQALEASDIRGIKFVEADCWHTAKDGTQPLKYWEIACTGWGGLPNPASGVRLKDHCPACGMSWFTPIVSGDGLFDERAWDGSDYFRIYPGGEFVTDRFKRLVESHKFTGVGFETMKQYIESDLKHPVRRNPRVAGLRHLYSKEEASKLIGAMEVW